ncbi:hypothetical protein F66182_533 [Fusarium sp. NRRL 66182]|nr:hypothetical protein F66182_533 [Fusarium sp. NRRL 66182]
MVTSKLVVRTLGHVGPTWIFIPDIAASPAQENCNCGLPRKHQLVSARVTETNLQKKQVHAVSGGLAFCGLSPRPTISSPGSWNGCLPGWLPVDTTLLPRILQGFELASSNLLWHARPGSLGSVDSSVMNDCDDFVYETWLRPAKSNTPTIIGYCPRNEMSQVRSRTLYTTSNTVTSNSTVSNSQIEAIIDQLKLSCDGRNE